MRLLGMLLALGIIGWVLYTAAGGGSNDTIVPQGYQQSLEKAHGVEQIIHAAENLKLEAVDED